MRVLVTRPEPGAGRTAARLAKAGHVPILLPLTEIHGVEALPPSEIDDAQAVVITSANAVRFAADSLVASLRGKPCFAVGPRTADLARSRGFADVTAGPGDADGLADLVLHRTASDARLAYLCGRLRRDTLERALRNVGRHCIAIETYDTRDLDYTQENLCAVLGSEPIDAVLIYSAHAAERLASLWPFAPLAEPTEPSTFICISRRTAEPVTGTPGVKTMIAAKPHEDAMFALLCDAAKRAAR